MTQTQNAVNRPGVRDYFKQAYSSKPVSQHEWTAGSASPELIKLVWEGVIEPGSRVLDVGCGIGSESVFLAARGMRVTGIDISPSAIEAAKKLAQAYAVEVDFRCADVLNLPSPDAEFDVFCDQGCFHHMADEERAGYVKELVRVLKPGGLFVLRSFSDKIPGGPQPRRISSKELIDTFAGQLRLEHLERVLSFSTPQRERPLGWHSIWLKP
ncbi:MAG TPA: methyltransferase domain-containing protein [Polyangiaceae bacterium]|nr:methyltransferase domain-containing protein [Polyangiaceae bacterium]